MAGAENVVTRAGAELVGVGLRAHAHKALAQLADFTKKSLAGG